MNRTDLSNIEEFATVATQQMELCAEILTGRDSHPFLEEQPSGDRLALALEAHRAEVALRGLVHLASTILDHTPEEAPVVVMSFDFWDGRIYNKADGHCYWLSGGHWVGAGTSLDGSLDEATAVDDFDMSMERKRILKDALQGFYNEQALGIFAES